MQHVQALITSSSRPLNYEGLLQLANLNQVTPLMYKNLAAHHIVPEEVMQGFRAQYALNLRRNALHLEETLSILDMLHRSGVSAIPLKGSFAAETLLGDMGLYPTADIDILVRQGDLKKAGESLIAAGYDRSTSVSEQDQLSGSYHLYFHKGSTIVELHWNLVRRYFEAPPSYWWEDAAKMQFRGMTLSCLSQEKYLLYLIFRLYCKAFMPLHHVVLMPALLGDYFDWEKFMRSTQLLRMKRLAVFTLKLMHDLLHINVPEGIIKKNIAGYKFLKNAVISGFINPEVRPHLQMLLFLTLLDTPLDILKVLIRRLFPPTSEIRLRYNIPPRSLKILPYYLLNPFLMLFKKTTR